MYRFPVDGDVKKLTSRYYQFGYSPYDIGGKPVANPDGTSFGYRHHGSDIDVKVGTATYAPEAGTVLFAGENGTAGIMIKIRGAKGVHRLLHMSSLTKSAGQSVKAGELIGYSGKTGYSNDIPHIHWDLEVNGKYVDPLKYITNQGGGDVEEVIPSNLVDQHFINYADRNLPDTDPALQNRKPLELFQGIALKNRDEKRAEKGRADKAEERANSLQANLNGALEHIGNLTNKTIPQLQEQIKQLMNGQAPGGQDPSVAAQLASIAKSLEKMANK